MIKPLATPLWVILCIDWKTFFVIDTIETKVVQPLSPAAPAEMFRGILVRQCRHRSDCAYTTSNVSK